MLISQGFFDSAIDDSAAVGDMSWFFFVGVWGKRDEEEDDAAECNRATLANGVVAMS